MKINLLTFGSYAESIGNAMIDDHLVQDTFSLISVLTATYPELTHKKYMLAVNKNIVQRNIALNEGDTVAILPPFSGG